MAADYRKNCRPYGGTIPLPDAAFYGRANWKQMLDETCKRLHHESESWTVEVIPLLETQNQA